MAQFDVHRNIGKLRLAIPFVVIVQSSLFDDYRRRLVVPLVRRSGMPRGAVPAKSRVNPRFRIEGIEVIAHPLELASVPTDALGKKVSSLAEHGQAITDSLDEVFTRSWG
jgi:toxin CcdB